MDATEITKQFWKIMNEFNDSGIDKKVWKDTVIEALGSNTYSISKLDTLYKEGIPENGTGCFFGEDFGVVAIGYMLLMRYGLKEDRYENWCNKQKREFRYLLLKLVGKDKPYLKTAYYTSKLEPLMVYFVNEKRKLFSLSADINGLFTLYGQTLCFHEKINDMINFYRFSTQLSKDIVTMFEEQYNRMIHEFDDCIDYLMGIDQTVIEVAISRVYEYIKDMKYTQEKVEENIAKYLEIIKNKTPFSFFLEAYTYIAEQYAEDAVKNEIKKFQRESIEFVGGGFGIKGMITGGAQAAIANKVYHGVMPHISNFSNRRIEYKMNAKKYQIFKDPDFLNEMKEMTARNIKILCDMVLQALPLGDDMSFYMPGQCRNRIDELYKMSSFIELGYLKNAILSVLQVYPFEPKSYELAYDLLGDDRNELEILAMMFGVCEFYDYKLSKQSDGLSKDVHFNIRNGACFGFDKIIDSEQQIVLIIKHINKIEHYINNGEPECVNMQELICQLLELLEKCGVSQGNRWLSMSAQTFYLQKKVYSCLKQISKISCNNKGKEINFFDYIISLELPEYCGKFLNEREMENFTKDEVKEAIGFIKRNTEHESENWSVIIKYEEWISKELDSMLKDLQVELEKMLKSLEEQEEEEKRKENRRKAEEDRKNTYINLVKQHIEQDPESFNLEFINQFRRRFKIYSRWKINEKAYIKQYDFELKNNDLRQFFFRNKEVYGQYILFFEGNFILTDHYIYLIDNSTFKFQKIAIRDINEILIYKSVLSNKYLREIVTNKGSVTLDTEKVDKVADAINLALDSHRINSYKTRYDKKDLRCGKCGSNYIKKGIISNKCLHCNNSNAETIFEHTPSEMIKDVKERNKSYSGYGVLDDEREQMLWLENAGLPDKNMVMEIPYSANLKSLQMEHHVADKKLVQKKSNSGIAYLPEYKEPLQEKKQSVIQDDWREKTVPAEISNIFSERFKTVIKGTDLERFCVNETIEQVKDKELYMRLSYMREKQPGQFVLYSNKKVVITDRFIIWGRLVIAIDELVEVKWKNNSSNSNSEIVLLTTKNGEKYLVNEEGQQKILSFILNAALDTNGADVEAGFMIEMASDIMGINFKQVKANDVFCTNCGKRISRTSKFCTFCGAKNNY